MEGGRKGGTPTLRLPPSRQQTPAGCASESRSSQGGVGWRVPSPRNQTKRGLIESPGESGSRGFSLPAGGRGPGAQADTAAPRDPPPLGLRLPPPGRTGRPPAPAPAPAPARLPHPAVPRRPRAGAGGRERGLTPLAGVVPLLGQRRRRRWRRRRLLLRRWRGLLLLRRRRLLLGRLRRRLLRGLLLLLLHRARPRHSPGSPVGGSDGVHLPG